MADDPVFFGEKDAERIGRVVQAVEGDVTARSALQGRRGITPTLPLQWVKVTSSSTTALLGMNLQVGELWSWDTVGGWRDLGQPCYIADPSGAALTVGSYYPGKPAGAYTDQYPIYLAVDGPDAAATPFNLTVNPVANVNFISFILPLSAGPGLAGQAFVSMTAADFTHDGYVTQAAQEFKGLKTFRYGLTARRDDSPSNTAIATTNILIGSVGFTGAENVTIYEGSGSGLNIDWNTQTSSASVQYSNMNWSTYPSTTDAFMRWYGYGTLNVPGFAPIQYTMLQWTPSQGLTTGGDFTCGGLHCGAINASGTISGGAASFSSGTFSGSITISNTSLHMTDGVNTGTLDWPTLTAARTIHLPDASGTVALSPLTTKGDVWVYSTADARLAVGTNGQVLTADSTQTTGLKWATPTTGTVTSVGLAASAQFVVTNSPVTTAGTLTLAWATQSANVVFAGPASGAAAAPTFRALVAADLPVFVASGASHAAGAVPDPGSTAGATRFLREDATWAVPPTTPFAAIMARQWMGF